MQCRFCKLNINLQYFLFINFIIINYNTHIVLITKDVKQSNNKRSTYDSGNCLHRDPYVKIMTLVDYL